MKYLKFILYLLEVYFREAFFGAVRLIYVFSVISLSVWQPYPRKLSGKHSIYHNGMINSRL